jgi:hypothetical protein
MKPEPKICPACNQPIVPPMPDLTPIKQRILDAVKRRPGISAEELRATPAGNGRAISISRC